MNFRGALGGSSARRGFLALILGTGIGNGLALALSPVITRLFDPANFGSFTLLAAVAMVLAPLMSLRLELAVPLAETDSASFAIVHAGLAASVSLGTACSAFFYVVGPVLGDASGQHVAGQWLWVTPIMASAMSCFSVLNSLAIRAARYRAIARRNVVMVGTTLGLQISAGLLGFNVGGLVVGFAVGQIVGAASLLFRSGLRSEQAVAGRRLIIIREAMSRYWRVPALLAPAGVVNAFGLQAPVLLFAHHYSSEVVGWFGLTQRILAAPVTLIGLSVAQVYLSEIARTRREGADRSAYYFWQASRALFFVGALAAVGLVVAGPALFELAFGSEWRMSGQFARVLAIALAAQVVASPLSQTLIVFERNGLQFAWDSCRLLAVVGSLYAAASIGFSAVNSAWVLSGVLTLMYAVSWEMSRRTVMRTH